MDVRTLGEFIIDEQKDFPGSSGDLSRILSGIRLAGKIVSQQINKAGLASNILGAVGSENVQGEEQQKLDVYADIQFIKALRARGVVCGLASEEQEDFVDFTENKEAKYLVAIDPLDGSSNIDVNVSVGTIFSVFRRISPVETPLQKEDFIQKGTEQVAAGYIIYGSSTMLVYTTGNGVNGFTFDTGIGVFFLSHPNMKCPEDGVIYSMNEGNLKKCEQGIQDYIAYCQDDTNDIGKPYTGRYIGSLVADFHRNLLKGGIYMYPATEASPNGKLRLLYECSPMAMLMEQAGGLATTGIQRVMEVEPTELHMRVPYIVGSKNMVEKLVSFLK